MNFLAMEHATGLAARATYLTTRMNWLLKRASAMTAAELVWRVRSEAANRLSVFPHGDKRRVEWSHERWNRLLRSLVATRADSFLEDASRIAKGELVFWGRSARIDPRRPDWRRDPLTHAEWPARSWRSAGIDPKGTWELNRQQHLLPLAAGAFLADRADWASLCLDQLLSWIETEPSDGGPGWSSAYEVACRLVTWTWVVPLVAPWAEQSALAQLESSFLEQTRFVERRPSRYSSENNHRIVELVALAGVAMLTREDAQFETCWSELEKQARRQTFADGGSREQASGYFLYVLETLWGAGVVAHASGRPLGALEERLSSMVVWLRNVGGAEGEPPPVGDDAEDRFLRTEYFAPRRASTIAARVEALVAGTVSLDEEASISASMVSVALPESGYAVLRSTSGDQLVVLDFDFGALGFGSLAAHGHADALSVLLEVGGMPALRDSGTGSYIAAEGREEFRSTAFHNTVLVDGCSQAQTLGHHLWGRRYSTRTEAITFGPEVDYVRASHDGYVRQASEAVHTRSVVFLKPNLLLILDRVVAKRACEASLIWQAMPGENLGALAERRAALAVRSSPTSSPSSSAGRFSPRYGWQEAAPRFIWTAEGAEIIFATGIATASRGVEVPVFELEHVGPETVVRISSPRTARVVEDWRSRQPEVSG